MYTYILHININFVPRFLAGSPLEDRTEKTFSPGPEPAVNGPLNMLFSVMLVLEYLELYMLLSATLALLQT
jgi:hypothetical protein